MQFEEVILAHEGWLVRRILRHAERTGYTAYTSTLEEAWRISIVGLSATLVAAHRQADALPEVGVVPLGPDAPLTQFAVAAGVRHRQRGISLPMFLGLLKHYRQTYLELCEEPSTALDDVPRAHLFVERAFDHIEVAVTAAWVAPEAEERVTELQHTARAATLEKNAYIAVFECLHDAVLLLDGRDLIVNLNHAAMRLVDDQAIPGTEYYAAARSAVEPATGYCAGRPVSEVFPWLGPSLPAADAAPTTQTVAVRLDGAERVFEVACSRVRTMTVGLIERILTLHDVTERMAASRAVTESEARFRHLMELSPVPMAIFAADARRLHANAAYCELWQVSPAEAGDAAASLITKAERLGLRAEAERLFAGETLPPREMYYEPARLGARGRPRTVRLQGYPIVGPDGAVQSVVLVTEDRTAEREAEAALLQSRTLLEAVLDHIPIGVWWMDRDLVYRGCNATFAHGAGFATPDDVVGLTDFDMPWAVVAPKLRAEDHRVIGTGTAQLHDEASATLSDGTTVWTRTSKIPLDIGDAGAVALLGCYENMTEQKRVIAELEAARLQAESANRAKTEFLSTVSHEMRTPLNAIVGLTEVLQDLAIPVQFREYVNVLATASQQLLSLINDLLDLSRIEAGFLELEREAFDVAPVVNQVGALLAPRAAEKGLLLQVVTSNPAGLRVMGAAHRLRQVVTNLVSNAVKFTMSGSVRVTAALTPLDEAWAALAFEVTDTGIGIPADKLEHIFERFTQVDSRTTREFGGTGLGLAISQRLVRHMGGDIVVKSAPGEGSSFSFHLRLPRAEPASEDAIADSEPPALTSRGLPRARILLVEDSPLNQLVVAAFLRNGNIELVAENDGLLGLGRFAQEPFDLVLMDIQMPVMDGVEATRRMRALEREQARARTPIIVMTAHALSGQDEAWLAAGCDATLTKPVSRTVLLSTVRRHLRHLPLPELSHAERHADADLHPIQVDEALLPHVGVALDELRGLSTRILDAIEQQALPLVRALAHRVKGDAGTFGFHEASRLGAAIERAAGVGDGAAAHVAARHLVDHFAAVRLASGAPSAPAGGG